MTALFLDDERFPPEDGREWAVVRSVAEAIAWVEANGCPDHVAFDHDLGADATGEPLPTGKDFASWLSERDLDTGLIPEGFTFHAHSQNFGGGRQNITGLLEGHLAYRDGEKAAGRPWPPEGPRDPWAALGPG